MHDTYQEALGVTLRKLRTADRFESEVRGWLAPYGHEVASQVLAFLREHRMLNDARAAEQVVLRRTGRNLVGAAKLRHELERRGAPEAVVASTVPRDQREHILELLQSRYRRHDSRAKAARFLASRGFAEEDVESAISEYFPAPDFPDESQVPGERT